MRKLLVVALMLGAAGRLSSGTELAKSVQNRSDPLVDRARRVLREVPVIDGHNDYPWQVREIAKGDLDALDIRRPQPAIHTDIARLTAGGVGGQFWSVYVPSTAPGDNPADAVTATLVQIDIVHRMMALYSQQMALALTADDVEKIQRTGKVASLIGMEGGHSINSSLGDPAADVSPRRAVHDAHPQPQHAVGGLGDRHAEVRRALAVRRRGRARDEPARHARRPQPRLAGDDGRRDARVGGAGDLLPLVRPRA